MNKAGGGEDALAFYLKDISRVPLMSREEEERVARAAARGSKDAREKLVRANLRFVVRVAKKYQGQGLPLADLVSEGNIGLMTAAERFDPDKGYRFLSYGVWWIRQAIIKAISEKARMIRLPQPRINDIIRVEKAQELIAETQGGNVGPRDIARLLEMDADKVEDILQDSQDFLSLSAPVRENGPHANGAPSALGDFLEDELRPAPEQSALEIALQDDIESVLRTLDEKEAAVIRCRYGIGLEAPMSLAEVGHHFHLTKERIRQIEIQAMKRLQQPSRHQALRHYVA